MTDEAIHQRDELGQALGALLVALGVVNDMPLTGPQLLMAADDAISDAAWLNREALTLLRDLLDMTRLDDARASVVEERVRAFLYSASALGVPTESAEGK